jgi:5'-3' exonuclease
MSVLVRSVKAAARMKQLSHEGVPTGPLMLFIGTLSGHLAVGPWDYVVVAWEGIPSMNWRLERYPEYKSGRLAGSTREDLSTDEELAREFCAAAGLFQDWAAEFEGDDIIAAWWRALRTQLPGVQIRIVSADRDLMQLTGEDTTWQSSINDPIGADHVRDVWGVEPERLPLLRAIAGDPSDGIPGLRGIGLQRAVLIAGQPETPQEILDGLEYPFGHAARVRAVTWYAISELRDPPVQPECPEGGQVVLARWHPQDHGRQVREVLEKYGMARLGARLAAGNLPWPCDS